VVEDNQAIWARWDASAPRAQAEGFLEHNGRWLESVEALTSEQRSSLTVDLGFLPEPVYRTMTRDRVSSLSSAT
jgi:hypothetical protein